MSCILVGNGTSLLDKEQGDLIDSYDTVVRFNQCRISGYEKHTGRKTNIWYSVDPFLPVRFAELTPLEKIVFHSWTPADKCKSWPTYTHLPNVVKLPYQTFLDVRAYGPKGYSWYSTGALATWEMVQRFGQVSLVGFDWWDREAHHYSDKVDRGPTHQPEMEKIYFDRLVNEGKAIFI